MLSKCNRLTLAIVLALLLALQGFGGGIFPMTDSTAHAMTDPNGGSGAPQLPWRYLALGDSYTIGESVDATERFPARLAQQLRANGINVGEPGIVAKTGWTTDELDRAIDANTPTGTFDMVTLLIGVNNQYRHQTAESYRPQFIHLLERAIRFAGNRPQRVVVVSIPDWGVTPFGRDRKNVGPEIDAYNAINRAETARLGAHYVDITPMSRDALHDPALVATDGLHPSGKMYAGWVDLILPVATKLFDGA
jgi:lysophospholipase L1-like esterase